jgi:hypothetical protein
MSVCVCVCVQRAGEVTLTSPMSTVVMMSAES